MGQLVSIVYKPRKAADEGDGYTRVPIEAARLVAGRGIEGDAKGSGNRQLNIMSAETLETLARDGFRAGPGEMGEQLIVGGLKVDHLPPGTRLRLGTEAQVEVVEPRTGCAKFERYQGRKREETTGRLGVMARVLIGGAIQVGDPVQIIDAGGTG